jgi:hypothetical protein
MTGWRAIAALLMGILVATPLAAQGPRIEPPAGGIFGPLPGSGQATDPSMPPSVPNQFETPELIVDLSRPRVSITSAFQGESILLFGMFDPPGEIVVVVIGPPARETVLRKQRVLGMWLNTGRQAFDDVPAYYSIAASQPLQRLLARSAGGEILSLEDRLQSVQSVGQREHEDLTRFRLGLVEVARGPLSGGHRPGHHPGQPAVPGRAAVSLAPARGHLRGQDLSSARGQDRRRRVAPAARRQGRIQRPARRLGRK